MLVAKVCHCFPTNSGVQFAPKGNDTKSFNVGGSAYVSELYAQPDGDSRYASELYAQLDGDSMSVSELYTHETIIYESCYPFLGVLFCHRICE